MIILDCEQRSEEWFNAKAGVPSASNFDQLITPKGAPTTGDKAKNYLHRLAGERITGTVTDTYQNFAMQRGTELEAEARNLFQMIHGVEVQEVGLCYPDEEKRYSCSPDGLIVDAVEGVEIKCPLIHTHVSYLLKGTVPTNYIPQVQGSMLVTGFNHWWFMSYYPGLPPMIIKVKRDDIFCAKLKVTLDEFCRELDEVTDRLREMG